MKNFLGYKLEYIVFLCGAVVMILEMVGSRVMAPYMGTSLFVWTSLIGVIMASLSIGYYYGGVLSDKRADFQGLSALIFFAGISILIMNVFKSPILSLVRFSIVDIKLGSVLSGTLLFALPSILLGMVSPYAVKLKLANLKNSGATVGSLYAVSTMGSIFGTFLSGFYLISFFGTTNILFFLSGILILLSLVITPKDLLAKKMLALCVLYGCISLNLKLKTTNEKYGTFDFDTSYNRVTIFNDKDIPTGKTIRRMNLGNQYASSMFTDSDDLVYVYEHYYDLASYFNPEITQALMIGGAAYSYPKEFLTKYPSSKLDVVEIDPGLTDLAKKFFKLKENPNLAIYHEDARVFLNRSTKKYDVIYSDAFNTNESIPYHLVTKETVQKTYDSLSDEGVVLVNIISSISGKHGGFLQAEYYTYKSVFPQVYIFPTGSLDPNKKQNIMLVALKNDKAYDLVGAGTSQEKYLERLWLQPIFDNDVILTDDFSPVERFF